MRGKVSNKERKGKFIYRFLVFVCLFLSAMKCPSSLNSVLTQHSSQLYFFVFCPSEVCEGLMTAKEKVQSGYLKKKIVLVDFHSCFLKIYNGVIVSKLVFIFKFVTKCLFLVSCYVGHGKSPSFPLKFPL